MKKNDGALNKAKKKKISSKQHSAHLGRKDKTVPDSTQPDEEEADNVHPSPQSTTAPSQPMFTPDSEDRALMMETHVSIPGSESSSKKNPKGVASNSKRNAAVARELSIHFQQVSPIVASPADVSSTKDKPKKHKINESEQLPVSLYLSDEGISSDNEAEAGIQRLITEDVSELEPAVSKISSSKTSVSVKYGSYELAPPVTTSAKLDEMDVRNIHGKKTSNKRSRDMETAHDHKSINKKRKFVSKKLSTKQKPPLNVQPGKSTSTGKRTISKSDRNKLSSVTPVGTGKKAVKGGRRLNLNKADQLKGGTTPITAYLKKTPTEQTLSVSVLSPSDMERRGLVESSAEQVQPPNPIYGEPIEVRLWHGEGKRRRTSDVTDLDVILDNIEEIAASVKEKTEESICRKAIDRFMAQMQRDIRERIEMIQETKELKLAVLTASRNVKRRREHFLELQKELLEYSEDIARLKLRRNVLKKEMSNRKDTELNSWLHSISETQTGT